MAHIKIKKGLNIPLKWNPPEDIKTISSLEAALDFTPFSPSIHPHLLVNIGDHVVVGQPIIEEKGSAKRIWTSPASGMIKEIRRGAKRVLESIIIDRDESSIHYPIPSLNPDEPLQFLHKTGLLSHLWMRPYRLPAHPQLKPRSIFVKAIESAPFCPSAELQLKGNEGYFQSGLNLLSSLVSGRLHLVSHQASNAFKPFQKVIQHTAIGPHPISHPSLHIQLLDPILKQTDVVWTIDTCGVVAIGRAIETALLHPERIISLSLPEHQGYYRVIDGASMQSILSNQLLTGRLISGDPLTGIETSLNGHLGFSHTVVCSIPEVDKRAPLHFFRWKSPSFTASKAYLQNKNEPVSTRLHGEERAFIDPNLYDRVMPLQIPTVPLIKSILSGDFETAEILGILEVAPEDFALPTFICPSKIEMVDIVRRGLQKMAAENLSI